MSNTSNTSNMSNMKAPRITDSSLRDGSHPMRHQFTKAQVRAVPGHWTRPVFR